ncbi:MAG: four helix bundle protein [Lentisphaerota bacterium]
MELVKSDAQDVADVYRRFRELATQIESASRKYDAEFFWVRKETLKAAESACADLQDAERFRDRREELIFLYQCRHEARETLRLLHYAMEARLMGAEDRTIKKEYEEAARRLEGLITGRESRLPMPWDVAINLRRPEDPAFFSGPQAAVGL